MSDPSRISPESPLCSAAQIVYCAGNARGLKVMLRPLYPFSRFWWAYTRRIAHQGLDSRLKSILLREKRLRLSCVISPRGQRQSVHGITQPRARNFTILVLVRRSAQLEVLAKYSESESNIVSREKLACRSESPEANYSFVPHFADRSPVTLSRLTPLEPSSILSPPSPLALNSFEAEAEEDPSHNCKLGFNLLLRTNLHFPHWHLREQYLVVPISL